MTITEAQKKLEENTYLIGEYDGDDEITHLAIAPTNGMSIATIADRVLNEESYDYLLICMIGLMTGICCIVGCLISFKSGTIYN